MKYLVFDDMSQCTEEEVQRLLPLVPAWRREYAMRYKHVFGQFCCLKAWEMVTILVNRSLEPSSKGESVNRGKWGKPYFVGKSVNRGVGESAGLEPSSKGESAGLEPEQDINRHFSISHCKTAIAVAVDSKPVGIDVESIRHADQALLERTMNEEERHLISTAAQPDRVFTRLWTQKEAYLKYTGTGLTDDLPEVLTKTDPNHFVIIEKEHYILSIYHE